MQKFIDGLRKELSDLWDKCFFGPAQREEFTPAFDENYTEELLSIHEHQVEVMKNYYEENKNIFKLVERREALFKTMEEFETRKNDSSRLANRGGALLKEEKIRKGINRELPKIEQKLKMDVGKWEEENERRFLINGCHYMDIITNQWAAFNAQKEQEILERHWQHHVNKVKSSSCSSWIKTLLRLILLLVRWLQCLNWTHAENLHGGNHNSRRSARGEMGVFREKFTYCGQETLTRMAYTSPQGK